MKTSNGEIKVIIGLGNPDSDYSNTYHNIGSLFVDYLINQKNNNISDFKQPSHKHFEFISGKTTFVKPLVFMNESGTAVKEMTSFFNLKPENILVVHDDSDMLIGNYKLSFDQNSAGHKGIQSIIDNLKTKKFHRLKIGIRPQEEKVRLKAEEFVLKKIKKKDVELLENVFNLIVIDLDL